MHFKQVELSEKPKSIWAFYWQFVVKNKSTFIGLQIAGAIWGFLDAAMPYSMNLLIDKLNGRTIELFGSELSWSVNALAIAFLAIFVIQSFGERIIDLIIGGYLMPRVRNQILTTTFAYMMGHSFQFFQRTLLGSLGQKLKVLADAFYSMYSALEYSIIPITWNFFFTAYLIFTMDTQAGWIFVVWYVLTLVAIFIASGATDRYVDEKAESENVLSGKMLNVIHNILAVKSYAQQDNEEKYIAQYQHDAQTKSRSMEWALFYNRLVSMGSTIVLMCVIMYLSLSSLKTGTMSLGNVVFLISVSFRISMHIWWMGGMMVQFYRALGEARNALSLFDKATHDVEDLPHAKTLEAPQGKIEFKNVTFGYDATDPLYKNLSVTINPQEAIGLVGYSGSGKSSFVNLIQRFFDVREGQILIDSTDVRQVKHNSLMQKIALIPQEPYLFNRTIAENIRYGTPSATQEDIETAAKSAFAHDFITNLPEGYQTVVTERGGNLSLGQRQRLILARAFLKDAPILIMDEATSALDNKTEKLIQKSFERLMKNRTTLVIAHRLSTVANLDRLLVFENGQIVEQGKHDELLAQNGLYAELWRMQQNNRPLL